MDTLHWRQPKKVKNRKKREKAQKVTVILNKLFNIMLEKMLTMKYTKLSLSLRWRLA